MYKNRVINFLKQKWLEIGIIAIGIQLIPTSISLFLGNRPFLILFTAIVIILLVFVLVSVKDIISEKRRVIGDGVDFNLKRKGIIFTIGLKSHDPDSTVMIVIKKLSPEFCGFIGTEKTNEANIGKSIVQAAGLKEDCYKEKIVDPTNIREIKEDTIHLVQWMFDKGLSKRDIVVDVTGGTAIMSVAAYIAADENRVDTQYIYSEYSDNRPVRGSQKALMISKYETD